MNYNKEGRTFANMDNLNRQKIEEAFLQISKNIEETKEDVDEAWTAFIIDYITISIDS